MKNKITKILSIVLIITTIFSTGAIALTASAANYSTSYGNYTQPNTTSDYAYWNGSKVVKSSGTTTNEIKWMQAAMNYLKSKGYISSDAYLDVDGSFGPASKKMCIKFQAKTGLTQDGKFGPDTIKKMIDVLNKKPWDSKPNNTNVKYNLIWPVQGVKTISGKYGKDGGSTHYRPLGTTNQRIHSGIDISSGSNCAGKNIYSTAKGKVILKGYTGARGNYVVIYHSDLGISSLYEHLNTTKVKTGDSVSAGTIIGTLGKSGDSSYGYGYHLHFGLMTGKATSVDYDVWKVGGTTKTFSPDPAYNKNISYSYK